MAGFLACVGKADQLSLLMDNPTGPGMSLKATSFSPLLLSLHHSLLALSRRLSGSQHLFLHLQCSFYYSKVKFLGSDIVSKIKKDEDIKFIKELTDSCLEER